MWNKWYIGMPNIKYINLRRVIIKSIIKKLILMT